MADVHTPEQRSYNMSQIRGKNTKPEEIVRKYLFSQGFRYRKNDSRLPGKPDTGPEHRYPYPVFRIPYGFLIPCIPVQTCIVKNLP